MSIDKHLNTIREMYNTLAGRVYQSEKFKDIIEIDKIGELIKSTRKAQGLTRKALCELSGVSYSTLNKIETGSVSVRLDIVINVSKTLGLNVWVG